MRSHTAIGLVGLALLAAACGANETGDAPEDGAQAPPAGDFDRERSEADARALLGVAEDDIEVDAMTRVVRRGDEEFMVTMDLIPGRQNLELDDDGTGTYVVTKVVVEVPDGEDPLVVQ